MSLPSEQKLQGKVILVTGASSGIGRGACIEASKQGATLLLTGRNCEALEETMKMLSGNDHRYLSADLTVQHDIEKLVEFLGTKIDGVVFSAGIMQRFPLRFANYEMLLKTFNINFFSVCLLTQKLIEKKSLNDSASLVYIGSISSQMAVRGLLAYAASKAALITLAKTVANEQAKRKIRSNVILAGEVITPLTKGLRTEADEVLDLKKYALERYAQPKDIAGLINFLLSDDSSWMTGASIPLDGGLSLD